MADWTPFNGGQSPLQPGTKFDSKHRDGSVTKGRTAWTRDRWDHHGTDCDIVAYRILVPAPEVPRG